MQRTRRNLYIFGATSFLNDTASEMAYWILPAFLTSLGAGPAALGLIEGLAESVASLGKLFSGYFTDILTRRKPLVVFGYTVANVAKPVLALATSWVQVLAVRFADRTAKGIRGAPRDVMLAESVEKDRAGSAFGLLQSMDSSDGAADHVENRQYADRLLGRGCPRISGDSGGAAGA
jgi:MFS family permease